MADNISYKSCSLCKYVLPHV